MNGEDHDLDRALRALGAPKAAEPKTSADAILRGAGFGVGVAATTAAAAKGVVAAGAAVGTSGGGLSLATVGFGAALASGVVIGAVGGGSAVELAHRWSAASTEAGHGAGLSGSAAGDERPLSGSGEPAAAAASAPVVAPRSAAVFGPSVDAPGLVAAAPRSVDALDVAARSVDGGGLVALRSDARGSGAAMPRSPRSPSATARAKDRSTASMLPAPSPLWTTPTLSAPSPSIAPAPSRPLAPVVAATPRAGVPGSPDVPPHLPEVAAAPDHTTHSVARLVRERTPATAATVFDLGTGASAGLGEWRSVGVTPGPVLSAGLVHATAGSGLRPELGALVDVGLLPGGATDANAAAKARGGAAAQGLVGLASGGDAAHLDLGWTLGARWMSALPSATNYQDPGAGWLWVTSGPTAGATVRVGGDLVAVARVRVDASPLDLDGQGARLHAWTTATIGIGAKLP